MKKFFLKILVFIIPIVLLAYAVDVYLSNQLKKSNTFAFKEYTTWNDVIDGKLNSEVFIYGSSRAWVQFDPFIIEDTLGLSTYNLGIDGHTFNMQYLRHKLALKYNKKPKLIIHSVDANTLQNGNFFNSQQVLPYMLWNSDFFEFTSNYKTYSYLDYKLPLVRFYGKTDAIITALSMNADSEKNKPTRVKGYKGQESTWNDDFDNAKKLMKTFEVKVDDQLYQMFDTYLEKCKANNIQVVFGYSPVYIEGQEFIKNKQEILDVFNKTIE